MNLRTEVMQRMKLLANISKKDSINTNSLISQIKQFNYKQKSTIEGIQDFTSD